MSFLYLTILSFLFTTHFCNIPAELHSDAKKILDTIEWVTIPNGEFLMGSTPEEADAAYKEALLRSSLLEKRAFETEVPQHKVNVSSYQISKYEITNAQYRAFINATGRPTPQGLQGQEIWKDDNFNKDTQPIVGVTWFDAQAFAEWIGTSLPTEAQWERAARGTEGRIYPWGNDYPKTRHHANYGKRYNRLTSVGQFPNGNSPDGIADLAGNVWEWCLDEFDTTYYQKNRNTIKQNPLNLHHRDVLKSRVIRGGAWDSGSVFLRSALRSHFFPLESSHTIGFRVVRPPPEIKNID